MYGVRMADSWLLLHPYVQLGRAGLSSEGCDWDMQEEVKRLRALADRAAGVTKDRVAARDALALGRQLAQLDATPEQVSCASSFLLAGKRHVFFISCMQSIQCVLSSPQALDTASSDCQALTKTNPCGSCVER